MCYLIILAGNLSDKVSHVLFHGLSSDQQKEEQSIPGDQRREQKTVEGARSLKKSEAETVALRSRILGGIFPVFTILFVLLTLEAHGEGVQVFPHLLS